MVYITKENKKQRSVEVTVFDGGVGVWWNKGCWVEVTCEAVKG